MDAQKSEHQESIVLALRNLGLAWAGKGDYDKAIDYHEKALDIFLSNFGVMHSAVAITYGHLGSDWAAKREFDTAIDYYEKCLAILEHFFESTYHSTKKTALNIAIAANKKGMELNSVTKYEDALSYFEKDLINAQKAGNDPFFAYLPKQPGGHAEAPEKV